MKRKGFVALSLALTLAIAPGFSTHDAHEGETTIDSAGNKVMIESLPKAKNKGKKEFTGAAEVENDSVAEIVNEQGEKIGEKKIKKNVKQKKEDKNVAKNKKEGELICLFCGGGGGSDDDGDTGSGDNGTRVVTVIVAADEEYRAAHSDWQTYTQNIIENADNGFTRDHDIDFQVKTFAQWNSEGANASEILQDLDRDWNGNGEDFLVGFTRDANFNSGGIAYVYSNDPYQSAVSVNLDQGAENTWHAAQHEFSHNYGLGHDPQGSGIKCIMNYDYAYSVDYWDQEHDDQIETNKSWYGK
ncbi:zinc-dependent metalloprotease [Alkalihalobacillus sp. CinArs1]|uniref:zinc-dependent metalloprotease n=1 Tax=Alkalihalobacillus sp. CinArs1 TaxID=2995314 RepID=UPI0022DD0C3C|nr:zinc-dependent metalloprotease [Alkalihalobacillus sp. CinArs1]